MKKIKIIAAIIMLVSAYLLKAQHFNPKGFDCVITGDPAPVNNPVLPGGIYKPESVIDYTSDPNAYFPVLIVYVQFTDDPGPDWQDCPWHRNQAPNYLNSVIATSKASGYGDNWYDAYDRRRNFERLLDVSLTR
jgi:hypothetical protein